MKLNRLGPQAIEVDGGNVRVLFSYATPVAAWVNGEGFYRTSTKHSVTTSRHINAWLAGAKAEEREQSWFDDLYIGALSDDEEEMRAWNPQDDEPEVDDDPSHHSIADDELTRFMPNEEEER